MASGEYGEGGDPAPPQHPAKKQKVTQETDGPVPRFLVIKNNSGSNFDKVSPFVINKVLYGVIGEAASVKKIRDGILVECSSAKQASRLLELKKFGEFSVSVTAHNSLNVCKGIVTCRDLLNCSVEEIHDELKSQGVIEVKRMKSRRDGELKDTASLILTFNRVHLPNKIRAAMYSLPVRAYIPSPMRCFKCQLFGHTASRCSKVQICVCGNAMHEGVPCNEPFKCVNCNENHLANSRNCPIYKEECAISEYKTLNKCSYMDARNHIKRNNQRASTSYAQATAKPTAPALNVSDIATLLIPQIKQLIEEVFKANIAAIFKTATPSIIQSSSSSPKPVTITDTTSTKPLTSNINMPRIPAVSLQQINLKPSTRTEPHMKPPAPPQPGNTVTDMDVESSDTSVDGDAVRDARKKDRRGWPKGKPRNPP